MENFIRQCEVFVNFVKMFKFDMQSILQSLNFYV